MMKPSVGLTVLTSSSMIFFTMVVLPALSSPLTSSQIKQCLSMGFKQLSDSIKTLISLSFSLAFLSMDSILYCSPVSPAWWTCLRLNQSKLQKPNDAAQQVVRAGCVGRLFDLESQSLKPTTSRELLLPHVDLTSHDPT